MWQQKWQVRLPIRVKVYFDDILVKNLVRINNLHDVCNGSINNILKGYINESESNFNIYCSIDF